MTSVSIDGLFAPMLEGGLESSKRDSLNDALAKAHAELMGRRGKDIGFYDLPTQTQVIEAVTSEAKRLRSLADDLIVLGIGGSSLGGQALAQGLGHTAERQVRLHFVDNVDPDTMAYLLESLEPARTAAVVITKSGGTVETLAQLLIVRRWFKAALGAESRSRMVFVTDPEKGLLRELSNAEGIRSFEVPSNVGGRFSVLTPVGLLPAAFLGIDIAKLCEGAAHMAQRVTQDNLAHNPAAIFAAGALLAKDHLGSSSLVMMPYSDALRMMSDWFVQLWAESLGKRLDLQGNVVHAGQTPIAAVGATDQHAQVQLFVEGPRDKVVVIVGSKRGARSVPIPDELPDRPEVAFLHGRDLGELLEAERRGTRAALLSAGVPVIDVQVPLVDEKSFGELLMLFEAATALAGLVMNINPFDQPGVEAGKKMALGLMGREGFAQYAAGVQEREALAKA